MSQYFLNCLECAQSLELGEIETLNFRVVDPDYPDGCMELGAFFLLHRGHPLMFTTKE